MNHYFVPGKWYEFDPIYASSVFSSTCYFTVRHKLDCTYFYYFSLTVSGAAKTPRLFRALEGVEFVAHLAD